MAKVFIFAEHVLNIVRSGLKEIEIPEGARISSAAADLIKENKIRIKIVAPGKALAAETSLPRDKPAAPPTDPDPPRKKATENSAPKIGADSPPEKTAEISEKELEEIVDRVIKRFKHLKNRQSEPVSSEVSAAPTADGNASADDDDLVICRCEEITKAEIKDAIRNGMRTLNGIKRITRAGMGLCQGQTCQRLVAQILAEELGLSAAEIDPTTARGPVRPLRLEVFANS
jgi:bacterioferritin-associated ferredoxin